MAKIKPRTAAQTSDELLAELEQALSHPAEIFGYGRYGDGKRWQRLDQMTGGLQPLTLAVLAARPKVGKSMFAAALVPTIAEQAMAEDKVVRVVSLEMSRKAYQRRMAAIMTGIADPKRIRQGLLDKSEQRRYRLALEHLSQLPIEYLANERDLTEEETFREGNSSVTISDVERFLRGKDSGSETYWWLLDHIGLLNDLNAYGDVTTSIYSLANKLANLAHTVSAGMVITHLTRASVGGRPRIESIAGSDQVGKNADQIFLLWRPYMELGELTEDDLAMMRENGGEFAFLEFYSRDEGSGTNILWWDYKNASYKEMPVDDGVDASEFMPKPKNKRKP
jgi:DnaB-like helicase C terminal domain